MKPLAYRIRPKTFDEVFGQEHLVGKNGILTAMLEKNKPMSFILYGPPGTGKTTIASIFAENVSLETYFFNASTDNKAKLNDILFATSYNDILIVIDEIHRMKTDIQDVLLPYVESGKAVIIGITTLNPYHSINMAIRSRCHLFEVRKLKDEDIEKALINGLKHLDVEIKIEKKALESIIRFANYEIRSALNLLESASLVLKDGDILTNSHVVRVAGNTKYDLDKSDDNYYQLLSALQKSIRGSDVDASIHYLARLITLGDLNSIIRRLLVIAYEDIGLANPTIGGKVLTASNAAIMVGLPEARIILSNVVIEMAISPKSNSSHLAIDKALEDYEKGLTGPIPDFLDNNKIKLKPEIYKYPHDDIGAVNDQTHLPNKIKNYTYFNPKDDNKYEKALKERLEFLDKIKSIKR
ncbi:MAG TPA: replication-associated recombination protein A [Acholeplasmataceae bacterium]|nr:replication-associated recombination protein A [Acholeplasmataceae bacterium]